MAASAQFSIAGKGQAHSDIGWMLLAAAFALPWLINRHAPPWTAFHGDAAMAVVLLLPATWLLLQPGRWPVSLPTAGLALFALVPAAQAVAGLYSFTSDAVVPFAYLAGLAMAAAIGQRAEGLNPGRLTDTLFGGLVIAGLVSTGLALGQWLQLDLGMLAYPLPLGGRPVANLAQPNLLATLLAWSLAGIWWGMVTGRVNGRAALLAAAFFLVGIAATQSRTGWIEVALLALAGSLTRSSARLPAWAVWGLAAFFVVVVVGWPWLTDWLHLDVALSLGQQVNPGRRPAIWALGLDAVPLRPWFGYGLGNSVAAQVAVAADHSPLLYSLTSHHNLFLDLAVWSGLPLGMLLSLGVAAWFVSRCREAGDGRIWILLVALLLLLCHAMLELPHCYALFLLPAGLMVGAVEALRGVRPMFSMPRWGAIAVVAGGAALLVAISAEYQRVERDFLAQRIRAARIGDPIPLSPPPTLLLGALGSLLEFLRIEPQPGMPSMQLDEMRRVAYRFPAGANLFRFAQATALNDRPDDARRALDLLCRMNSAANCQLAMQAWDELGRSRFPEMLAVRPAKDH